MTAQHPQVLASHRLSNSLLVAGGGTVLKIKDQKTASPLCLAFGSPTFFQPKSYFAKKKKKDASNFYFVTFIIEYFYTNFKGLLFLNVSFFVLSFCIFNFFRHIQIK